MSVGTLVLLVVIYLLIQLLGGGQDGRSGGAGSGRPDGAAASGQSGGEASCRTGADAERSADCAAGLFTTSVQSYWRGELPRQTGVEYQHTRTVVFHGSTESGCGEASSQMGPFYCPVDRKVYLDSTFFHDMLQGRLGARGGPFSTGYVVAHEYGHHVEDQLGILRRIRSQQGAGSDSVKTELMADCLGGMWARHAAETRDAQGQAIIENLTRDDVSRAIDAARAVGDDRIQQRSSGRVDPEQWTHGSARQRMQAFETGYRTSSVRACNLFD